MAIKRASENATGSFLKPAELTNALAILFEPKSIKRDVPNTFKGVTKNRDEITTDLTIFTNQDQLDGKQEPVIQKGMVIGYSGINSSLEPEIGNGAVVGIIRKKKSSEGNEYYALVDPDSGTFTKVDDYHEKREAARQAAIDSAPSFD